VKFTSTKEVTIDAKTHSNYTFSETDDLIGSSDRTGNYSAGEGGWSAYETWTGGSDFERHTTLDREENYDYILKWNYRINQDDEILSNTVI
jgi:hypothetical protein